ncbi:hypothetical protein F5051DRAFT_433196 [Lentinula edodes]|nr:hypothetical protein F5051DRAFT_433196 [Lentinula edodes]
MDTPDIESGPTPAVKNLLSRFESLAVDNSATASRRKSLQVPMQTSLARAPSGASSSSVSPGLRTVSSSSSLKSSTSDTNVSTKRPPPPPPPSSTRSYSRGLSPAPPYPFVFPLLRPVPIAKVLNTSVDRAPQHGLPPSPNVSINENEHEEGLTPTCGVSMLRSKFLPEEYHSQSSSNSMSDLDDPFSEDITDSSTDDPDSSTTAVVLLQPSNVNSLVNFLPPTRTIALWDKLPPKRSNNAEGAANGDSDEDESGDEDDDKGSGTDLLPDATQVPAKGMDTKDFGIKDGKVTAVEFNTEFLVCIGLKEGHIFEIDVRNGDLLGVKRL